MFGEADPHEPPLHHENAAGFVPPIIRQTWLIITTTETRIFTVFLRIFGMIVKEAL